MHYICTGGCNGESKEPGVCKAEFCAKHGELLTECDCADGEHQEPGNTVERDDMDLGE